MMVKKIKGLNDEPISLVKDNKTWRDLIAKTKVKGYEMLFLSGDKIKNKEDLFNSLKNAFGFPYFGENWDALIDCLRNLEWLPARGYVIFYDNPNNLFDQNPEDMLTFLGIIKEVSKEWKQENIVFKLYLKTNKRIKI